MNSGSKFKHHSMACRTSPYSMQAHKHALCQGEGVLQLNGAKLWCCPAWGTSSFALPEIQMPSDRA
eukprot:1158458-Pelagomonas_calceolata.AAC.3